MYLYICICTYIYTCFLYKLQFISRGSQQQRVCKLFTLIIHVYIYMYLYMHLYMYLYMDNSTDYKFYFPINAWLPFWVHTILCLSWPAADPTCTWCMPIACTCINYSTKCGTIKLSNFISSWSRWTSASGKLPWKEP